MVSPIAGTITVPPGVPDWARGLAQSINREFQALALRGRARPAELARCHPTDLPDPAAWPGHLIAVWTGSGWEPRFSDGASWRVIAMEI